MTADVIHLADYRRNPALSVPCPYCGVGVGRMCVIWGTQHTRIGGPHPDRIATAQANLEDEDA